MSAADVWMPLYVADYLQDTGHLTATEHGAYLLLLMQAWTRDGALPADDKRLAAMARCSPKEWRDARDAVMAFFDLDGDCYRNPRLERERARAATITQERSKAGAIGAAKRWQTHGKRIAEPLANPSQIDAPSQSQLQEEERTPPPPSVVGSPRGCRLPPDWTPSQPEREFAEILGLNPDAVAAQFADYWHAKAGKDAAKRDWPATWRGWCRREAANTSRPLQKKPGKLDWLYDQMRREREERQASEPETREARLIL